MNVRDLKVGDRVRITGIPKVRHIHPETVAAYERIIARGRSVRIQEKPADSLALFETRYRNENQDWIYQYWLIDEDDGNWVPVKSRKKNG